MRERDGGETLPATTARKQAPPEGERKGLDGRQKKARREEARRKKQLVYFGASEYNLEIMTAFKTMMSPLRNLEPFSALAKGGKGEC